MHDTWSQLEQNIAACDKCGLCTKRTNTVVGEGSRSAQVLLVGEGPGAQEDRLGRPFVGAAGRLLDSMLEAVPLRREQVYIANIVKCRPPGNRVPAEAEARACLPYLQAQIQLIAPRLIICLGNTAARYLVDEQAKVSRDRGRWIQRAGLHILITYHPAALLRDESLYINAWRDMMLLRRALKELA